MKGLKIFNQSIQSLCTDSITLERRLGNKRRLAPLKAETTAQKLAARVCMARRRKYAELPSKSIDPGYNATFLEGCEARIIHNKVARGSEPKLKQGLGPMALQWERDPSSPKKKRMSYEERMRRKHLREDARLIEDLDRWERKTNNMTEEHDPAITRIILRAAIKKFRQRKFRSAMARWKDGVAEQRREEARAEAERERLEAEREERAEEEARRENPAVALLHEVQQQLKRNCITMGQLFQFMDKNRNNLVSRVEFGDGLKYAGVHLTPGETDLLFGLVDIDSGGDIDLQELKRLILRL
jgi:hypothetical protein